MLDFKKAEIGFDKILFNTGIKSLEKGQLISLLGKNGSGKSTFFSSLLGLQKIISGKVFVNFNEINIENRNIICKLFSYVNTHFIGLNYMTVFELISLGRTQYTPLLGNLNKFDHQIIEEKTEKLKIKHLLNKYTNQISDGERQLCVIAKALVEQTPILLLDEPTSFLDYSNKISLMETLKDLAKNENLLIIQANHDVDLCFEFSDVILWIDTENKVLNEIQVNDFTNKKENINKIFSLKSND